MRHDFEFVAENLDLYNAVEITLGGRSDLFASENKHNYSGCVSSKSPNLTNCLIIVTYIVATTLFDRSLKWSGVNETLDQADLNPHHWPLHHRPRSNKMVYVAKTHRWDARTLHCSYRNRSSQSYALSVRLVRLACLIGCLGYGRSNVPIPSQSRQIPAKLWKHSYLVGCMEGICRNTVSCCIWIASQKSFVSVASILLFLRGFLK